MEPITLITTISAGLKLIEQFRETALRFMGRTGSEPSVTVEAKTEASAVLPAAGLPTEPTPDARPNKIEIRRNGQIAEEVRAGDLRMGQWDQQRYETLKLVIDLRFEQFNELEKEYVLASGLQKTQVRQQMEMVKSELCPKFREMLDLYEKTLGVPLGDHFALQSVCGN